MHCDSLSTLIFGCVCVEGPLGRLEMEHKYVSLAHMQFIYSFLCVCACGKTEVLAVCGNLHSYLSPDILFVCGSSLVRASPLCDQDIDVLILLLRYSTVNKADRVKIALCVPTKPLTHHALLVLLHVQ